MAQIGCKFKAAVANCAMAQLSDRGCAIPAVSCGLSHNLFESNDVAQPEASRRLSRAGALWSKSLVEHFTKGISRGNLGTVAGGSASGSAAGYLPAALLRERT